MRGGKAGASAQFAAAAGMLQLRLLEAYLSMPSAAAFAAEHEALIKLCARSLRPTAAAAAAAPAAPGGAVTCLPERCCIMVCQVHLHGTPEIWAHIVEPAIRTQAGAQESQFIVSLTAALPGSWLIIRAFLSTWHITMCHLWMG